MPMDWKTYRESELAEYEARRANPITVEVPWEVVSQARWALMLLRRVQGNTNDSDLLRVEDKLKPLFDLVHDPFRDVPAVKAEINKRREMLNDYLIEKGDPKRLPPLE